MEVLKEGKYLNLPQLLLAADRLPESLQGMGVVVRAHGNGDDTRIDQLREALESQLQGQNSRSAVVIDRDAHTMAVAWRRRRRAHGKWPGAWIVTKDRAMSPAYAATEHRDKVALTLTPAQWATFISVAAEPMDVEELARAAADQFVDEAMWTLPVRYPPDVALELAKQLSPEHGGSGTDLRIAQMTLDEVLEGAPTGTALASRVLSARAQRVNSISRSEADRLSQGINEQASLAQQAELKALLADRDRLQTEQEVSGLRTQKQTMADDLAWEKEKNHRVKISAALLGLLAVLLTASLFVASPLTWALLGAGLVVAVYATWRWTSRRDTSLLVLIPGAIAELVGMVSGTLEIFNAL